VVLKVIMIIFICGLLKHILTTLKTSNCKWATALSIFVIIVYFSVILRDARRAGKISSPVLSKGRQRVRS